jgi:hypothetical protein
MNLRIDPWRIAADALSVEGVPPVALRIRDLGRIDSMIRERENEIIPDLIFDRDGGYYPAPGSVNRLAALDYTFSLANLWVAELFEVVSLVVSGRLHKNLDPRITAILRKLKNELLLVRTPLTKMQVRGTGKYIHYPESMIGEGISVGWRVQDQQLTTHIISRRNLADQFLALFVPPE